MAERITQASSRNALEAEKICIMHKTYPDNRMTNEQFVALKACIMKRILTSKIRVNFHNTAMKDGWALIICANKETS
ncbi:DUF4780 domain-containing protein, partial [Klebsiella pneumoniae]|uniref:DUF4780 domain-containing protein n=1 Tax=Klebsiella pneumoniae TaxID=573 RepID=UPI0040556125